MMLELLDLYQGQSVRAGAMEFLYDLMKERDPEINISHSTLPTFEQHRQFVTRRPYRFWYLIGQPVSTARAGEDVWIGYISATHNNEIGIVIRKPYRSRGYGPAAILKFMAVHRPLPAVPAERSGYWLANIAPENTHSQHMFGRLGFTKIQSTYARLEEESR